MRTFSLSVLVVLALSMPFTASGEVGKTYIIHTESGDVSVVCSGDNTVEAVEINSNNPLTFSWDPACTSIESGQTVHWSLRAPAFRPHDPATELDAGVCFQATRSPPSGQSAAITPTKTFEVQFKYEGGLVSTRTVTRNTDGTITFGAWHSCPGALDLQQTTLAEAVIPYFCAIHRNMQGLVVVEASGSVSVG